MTAWVLSFLDAGILQQTAWLILGCVNDLQSLPQLEDYKAVTVILVALLGPCRDVCFLLSPDLEGYYSIWTLR